MTSFEKGFLKEAIQYNVDGQPVAPLLKVANADMDGIAFRLIALASVLTSMGIGAVAHKRVETALENTPDIPKNKIKDILQHAGVDKHMPLYEIPGLRNAFYASPGHVSVKSSPKDKHKEPWVKKLGLIGYDPNYNKAGILAHEVGHAAIRTTKPWYSPSRFNQSVLRPIGGVANVFSGTAGALAGIVSESPLIGSGIGLGFGLLTGLPTLINEIQATGYAKRYLDDSSHKSDTIAKNKKSLSRAFTTYLLASTLPGTLAGAGGGFYGQETANDYTPPASS